MPNNVILRTRRRDVLIGSTLRDGIFGFGGADVIRGGGDGDAPYGDGSGQRPVQCGGDRICAEAGDDRLRGDGTVDGGADVFAFSASFRRDRVEDFRAAEGERTWLRGAGVAWTALDSGGSGEVDDGGDAAAFAAGDLAIDPGLAAGAGVSGTTVVTLCGCAQLFAADVILLGAGSGSAGAFPVDMNIHSCIHTFSNRLSQFRFAKGPPMSAAHAHAHGPHHDHDHGHSHAPEVTSQNERVVLIGFLLTFGFMFAEIIGGLLSGSLALIADAGHMLTDAAALALAWAGFRFGRRKADSRRTFGYMRFEVLAGFVNAVALILLVGWIAYEAVERLLNPAPVLAGPMMIVAVLGLAVNGGVFYMLMQGDREHVNIKGAMLHVLGDLLGSVAAIAAAGIIWLTGWTPVDPILSVLLSALILKSAWSLLKGSMHILMEGAPSGLDPEAMRKGLVDSVPGLADVSHIHVWSITSGRATATMHISLTEAADPAETVGRLKAQLAESYEIGHSTIEIDWSGAGADCSMGRAAAQGGAPDGHDHDHAHGHDHHDHDHHDHDHGHHDHNHDHDHGHEARPAAKAKAHAHGPGGCDGHAH